MDSQELFVFAEDPGSVLSVHMIAHNCLTLAPRDPMPSSHLRGCQACAWCPDMHVSKVQSRLRKNHLPTSWLLLLPSPTRQHTQRKQRAAFTSSLKHQEILNPVIGHTISSKLSCPLSVLQIQTLSSSRALSHQVFPGASVFF